MLSNGISLEIVFGILLFLLSFLTQFNMDLSLKNKNALVCGSTQGIGKAIAIELARNGANVILFARNEASLKRVVKELDKTQEQSHDYLVADFHKPGNVLKAIDQFLTLDKTIHILVNNTGGPSHGTVMESDADKFMAGFSAHIINNQNLVTRLAPGMKESGYGRIINVISISVKTPIAGLGVSNTIRGAVASWAKTLANELGPFGITVNNILPGYTKTGRLDELFSKKAEEAGISHEEFEQQAADKIPSKRLGGPEEMGYAAAFLASPSAGYINGINLPVDGGITPTL
jgi:3-oxoacyl-[acyl-carrier protein] reductase